MKLVSMKLDAKEQKNEAESVMVDKPAFPYGLSIDLNEDALKKLGVDELPDVDDDLTLVAHVAVTSVSDNKYANGRNRRVCLQIVAMDLAEGKPESDTKDSADTLYNK